MSFKHTKWGREALGINEAEYQLEQLNEKYEQDQAERSERAREARWASDAREAERVAEAQRAADEARTRDRNRQKQETYKEEATRAQNHRCDWCGDDFLVPALVWLWDSQRILTISPGVREASKLLRERLFVGRDVDEMQRNGAEGLRIYTEALDTFDDDGDGEAGFDDEAVADALATIPCEFQTFPYCSKKCGADARKNGGYDDSALEVLRERIVSVQSELRDESETRQVRRVKAAADKAKAEKEELQRELAILREAHESAPKLLECLSITKEWFGNVSAMKTRVKILALYAVVLSIGGYSFDLWTPGYWTLFVVSSVALVVCLVGNTIRRNAALRTRIDCLGIDHDSIDTTVRAYELWQKECSATSPRKVMADWLRETNFGDPEVSFLMSVCAPWAATVSRKEQLAGNVRSKSGQGPSQAEQEAFVLTSASAASMLLVATMFHTAAIDLSTALPDEIAARKKALEALAS